MAMRDDASRPHSSAPPSDERRRNDRFEVIWAVDCVTDETFLYASITNISEMGIFVKTLEPLPIGTRLLLSFSPPGYEPFKLAGVVAWQNRIKLQADNPNPGMGVRFTELGIQERERLVEVIRTIAYLRGAN
ncbi:TIGR02266 family protein [Pendulispora brunnea]|uniref:TIGR02266 family protein n=1 Tax=Pendulispora brunnea TaxID=2905690 RepID=A0ABZ2KNN5_9BACT